MEKPIVIEHRDALIYLLNEAAELEHAIACQYLYAGFSLKRRVEEGLTEKQLQAVNRWRATILKIGTEEMLHLALVNNLLSAVGAAPRVGRPNMPQRGRYYAPGVQLALLPFGEQALRHFVYLERPEGINLQDAEGFEVHEEARPVMSRDEIVPRPQDFGTVGFLYRSIEEGFKRLVERHGEEWLFIGPKRAQASGDTFRWPDLVRVVDLESACRAIDTIVEQGEGPRGHWADAHYGRLLVVLGEYLTMRKETPAFEPSRPVIPTFARKPRDTEAPAIANDDTTGRILDSFNVAYEVMLQSLARFFGSSYETEDQLSALADVAVGLMISVIKPLGEYVTKMPVGTSHPDNTAGPAFEMFYGSGFLLPHSRAAWILLHERLLELSGFLNEMLTRDPDHTELSPVVAAVDRMASTMADNLAELKDRKVAPPSNELATDRTGELPI
jgi:Ferritin-like